ncbi:MULTISPECIES: DUF1127 domain-containing protein [unclassified Mesorhizobium]|uniref:DUF1127 domain-containing protein n=1 Tax=unclassified Mesorhizobium TaxID=325217 RepID=UPI000FCCDAFC|nr:MULTISPECIES: DUF1127 domain-containing protein [unclassified Mesorhizobium]RUW26472.1 DUF1127 domain-containing protein [Mesorhizobium sp. M4B.F.Ca.ET.013.02.1.1]RUW72173.1 DUF1127 domain-containing protein [Mesorhizobium sp. M4B.F.Ca.ET.049.02.1.2]RVD19818.1 DUF1127 domain-containing protein [Mesorhizobium sp. M4B.F.Ca.ET.017.02.2.1]RVD35236.1 DUF1127 domain-containing protein [Mesorhizobium sp. M4B.F.Ca.ET.019.03.1.1]TGQ15337.1 DUF1127 domain-containing protein [Mesorhizobium sp. M4B.F.C
MTLHSMKDTLPLAATPAGWMSGILRRTITRSVSDAARDEAVRRSLRHVGGFDDRLLRDIGVGRDEIFNVVALGIKPASRLG